jgi:uncharacterized membrane protein YgcG
MNALLKQLQKLRLSIDEVADAGSGLLADLKLGFSPTDASLPKLFKHADKDNSGAIDFVEYFDLIKVRSRTTCDGIIDDDDDDDDDDGGGGGGSGGSGGGGGGGSGGGDGSRVAPAVVVGRILYQRPLFVPNT